MKLFRHVVAFCCGAVVSLAQATDLNRWQSWALAIANGFGAVGLYRATPPQKED